MSDSPLSRSVRVYKALAHPARLRILAMLRRSELCACQVTAILGLAPSTVSAHLKELRLAGLVEERKVGRWVYSRLVSDSETARLLEPLWRELAADPEVQADARLLERLLEVDLTVLCRADLDLGALGLLPVAEGNEGGSQLEGRIHE